MKINILDCTLRDGGYINNFRFGTNRIQTITEKLCAANIEIIECGFLQSGQTDVERTLYSGVEWIPLPKERGDHTFVAMIAFGEINAYEIAPHQPDYIDGIRLTFHNDEWDETRLLAMNIMEKGYKVFIQPVGTASYTDEELLYLVKQVNELNPYAFYIVDTLGSMYKNDLLRMFFLVEHNLAKGISLGFHSHNNMQLSFANSMTLLELHTERHIIIDSSVFGIGRGAGNLNTELITHYINNNIDERYDLIPLLELIDDIILPIYKYTPWGFSEPYYLSAITGVHPNYASYLIDKQSVGMTKISELLKMLPEENKHLFNRKNVESIYLADMSNKTEDAEAIEELSNAISDKKVLVLAPGSSVRSHSTFINEKIEELKLFVISINFAPEEIKPDLVFVSNRKRFGQLNLSDIPIAVTSNISVNHTATTYIIEYDSLLQENSDSSGIMVLRFLKRLGVSHALLAGYDGFTGGADHYSDRLDSFLSAEAVVSLNRSMNDQLRRVSDTISLEFITPTAYEGLT